ncbi:peptidylprolyl isomerase [Bacillus sp. J14TS2]|uniref:peptidylprolyl isomerase n=1 Tax=Bacillus sp. J14TS2 TaxID=2807188 RepID=UPI001BB4319F|nr:peptidylprolyl isomerase [Bacillus sp. J14TS2]
MLLLTLLLSGCGNGTNPEKVKSQGEKVKIEENPIVTIEMEDGGIIKIELEPNIAPNTVANFVALVEDHFYDGLIFHRVIPGFMIQGGDPDGNGSGGPGYSIAGEFSSNGVENHLKHERGVISMARTKEPDSAGSQFFIIAEDASHLDNDYAAFGKVTEGMDIVDKIVNVERDAVDKPLTDQVMKKVTIDTMGVTYPEVEKVQ